MENKHVEPSIENVVYIDEYPELKKRVWLRRLNQQRQLGRTGLAETGLTMIIPLPTDYEPDGA
jgi:hypothetical protein